MEINKIDNNDILDLDDIDKCNFIEIPSDIKLLLGQSLGKGRGVFANQCIKAYQLIHISPVLLFPQSEDNKEKNYKNKDINVEKEILSHYTYTWVSKFNIINYI
jgi:hypothetical protein